MRRESVIDKASKGAKAKVGFTGMRPAPRYTFHGNEGSWVSKTCGVKMLHELGILFDIDEMGAKYRYTAWKIFMGNCDPTRLAGSTLYEGETTETLARRENVFCIAVQSQDAEVIEYVKTNFVRSPLAELMPLGQCFLQGEVMLRHPLAIRARIDEAGTFFSWHEAAGQSDQQICAEAGWPYGGTVDSLCNKSEMMDSFSQPGAELQFSGV